jgi:hypothetical protein
MWKVESGIRFFFANCTVVTVVCNNESEFVNRFGALGVSMLNGRFLEMIGSVREEIIGEGERKGKEKFERQRISFNNNHP